MLPSATIGPRLVDTALGPVQCELTDGDGAEHRWIESGSHLGFWLAPNADPTRAAARDFLDRHCQPRN